MQIHALPPATRITTTVVGVVGILVAQLLAVVAWAAPALAADNTWTVTSTADTAGTCAPGDCTLRAAIATANTSAGSDLINFNIAPGGLQTITVGSDGSSPLPAITGSDVVLDATTQPGTSGLGVRLDDPDTSGAESGLTIQGQRVTVRGVIITRFDAHGIFVASTSRDSVIAGNRIGTADGTTGLGVRDDGIRVRGGGGHRIGGTTAADRNVVSGGGNDGIEIEDSSDNVVTGNYVGMTADGLGRLPNADTGIQVDGVSLRNRIGGTSAAERNLSSGNSGIGIQLLGSMRTDGTCESPEQNLVQGNWTGVNVNGARPSPYGNQGAGIELGVCARNNTIGGSDPAARNVSSGNHDDGIQLDGNGGPGGTGAVCGNTVEGNYTGLDPLGRGVRPNTDDGIDLDRGACNNLVRSNIVAGNQNDGIDLHERNANGATTSGNQITGNIVGLAADRTAAQPNLQNGVHIRQGSPQNTVEGNTIASSGMNGVAIENAAARSNTVRNNTIGLAADGTTRRGNGGHGVLLTLGTRLNQVVANTISASGQAGIAVDPAGVTPTDANQLSQNRLFGNNGLAIDLAPGTGVNPNDGATGTSVGNLGLDYPVITGATTASVRGTAPANSAVEVFIAEPGSGETNGEGARYLGGVTAESDGTWCLGGLSADGSVTATATDSAGNTSEFAANATVSGSESLCSAGMTVVADTFSRTVTDGWGTTDGFLWAVTSPAVDYTVNGAAGSIRQSSTGTRTASLGIGRQNVSVRMRFRFSSLPTASWNAAFALTRFGGTTSWYGVRVRTVAGSVDDIELNRSTPDLGIVRIGTGTSVPEFVAGGWYWLRLDATGGGTTTTVRGKVWRDGDSEPTAWTVSTADTTATLQGTGGVGVRVQSSSAAQPANVEVDDYTVTSSD